MAYSRAILQPQEEQSRYHDAENSRAVVRAKPAPLVVTRPSPVPLAAAPQRSGALPLFKPAGTVTAAPVWFTAPRPPPRLPLFKPSLSARTALMVDEHVIVGVGAKAGAAAAWRREQQLEAGPRLTEDERPPKKRRIHRRW